MGKAETLLRTIGLMACAGMLLALGGCGKPSRFDEAVYIDVCGLVGPAALESVFGRLAEAPRALQSDSGAAGTCQWIFEKVSTRDVPTLYAIVMTPASAKGVVLKSWFKLSLEELKASLGTEPWEIREVGVPAFLLQARQPEHSEVWMRQGDTYVVLRLTGGSASQLVKFAQMFSQAMEPK